MPSIFAFRPDAARRHIRLALQQLEHASNCAADCSRLLSVTGEPVPRSVADYWRMVALDMARYHRENARRVILDEWLRQGLFDKWRARMLGRKPVQRRAAA